MCSTWLQIFAPYCESRGRKKVAAPFSSRNVLSDFVPSGLNDRGQAIDCPVGTR